MVPMGGDEAETPVHNLIVIFLSYLTCELKEGINGSKLQRMQLLKQMNRKTMNNLHYIAVMKVQLLKQINSENHKAT